MQYYLVRPVSDHRTWFSTKQYKFFPIRLVSQMFTVGKVESWFFFVYLIVALSIMLICCTKRWWTSLSAKWTWGFNEGGPNSSLKSNLDQFFLLFIFVSPFLFFFSCIGVVACLLEWVPRFLCNPQHYSLFKPFSLTLMTYCWVVVFWKRISLV